MSAEVCSWCQKPAGGALVTAEGVRPCCGECMAVHSKEAITLDELEKRHAARGSPPSFEFVCPFCNGIVRFVEDGLLHAMPPCGTFLAMEITDYVAAVNRIVAGGHMKGARVDLCKPCAQMLRQVELTTSAVGGNVHSALRRTMARVCTQCRAQLPAELRARLDDERNQEN